MSADRSKHPIVHFVGSIPLPDTETFIGNQATTTS
jgi:hypothetical protein